VNPLAENPHSVTTTGAGNGVGSCALRSSENS
jgi:hypothetical protein